MTAPRAAARSLGGRVVGVAPRGVVGRVEDLADERRELADGLLDALLECDVRGAAPLAPASESEVHVVPAHVDQLDIPAVRGHCRVDLAIEEVADRPLEVALGRKIPEVVA